MARYMSTEDYSENPSFAGSADGNTRTTTPYVICFIGAGPNTLYCLERLVTRLRSGSMRIGGSALSVVIYDKSGSFGPGVHSKDQPATNHLNRTAEQVSLCADASHKKLGIEVYERKVETLYQWAAEKFKSTNNPRYHIAPQQWVDRALVGEALSDTFDALVLELRGLQVAVRLVRSRVTDLVPAGGGKHKVVCDDASAWNDLAADFVFLCTGHTSNMPAAGTLAAEITALSNAATSSLRYVHHVYPIEKITNEVVPPSSTVACLGMGLAAIDCINWLTAGRGGYFVEEAVSRKLKYMPSGFEPRKIFPMSESGLFVRARAFNEKENVAERRHSGIVFNESMFASLRSTEKRQWPRKDVIDAEVIPLLALEMMMLYYRTLLSVAAVGAVEEEVKGALDRHIKNRHLGTNASTIWDVYRSAHARYRGYLEHLDVLLKLPDEKCSDLGPADHEAVSRFLKVRLGPGVHTLLTGKRHADFLKAARRLNKAQSPWGHDGSILRHTFDWNEIVDPLAKLAEADDLHAQAASWLENDILGAIQGNLSNPIKAAIDGAIRDLRPCFRQQVEWGAGGPSGTRDLFTKWYRVTNRLAVGTTLELMRKMLALVEVGIVDLSFCRDPLKEVNSEGVRLKFGDRSSVASVVLNAVVHRFNLSLSDSELYQNLRRRGVVREWAVTDGAESYSPGSLEVDRESRLVVGENGVILPNIVALGSPVDGPFYYRLALSRPYVSDTILFDADQAVNSVVSHWSSLQANS